jgi:hypothetical protein
VIRSPHPVSSSLDDSDEVFDDLNQSDYSNYGLTDDSDDMKVPRGDQYEK